MSSKKRSTEKYNQEKDRERLIKSHDPVSNKLTLPNLKARQFMPSEYLCPLGVYALWVQQSNENPTTAGLPAEGGFSDKGFFGDVSSAKTILCGEKPETMTVSYENYGKVTIFRVSFAIRITAHFIFF